MQSLNSWRVVDLFFNDSFRRSKFEPSELYVGKGISISSSDEFVYSYDGRILENKDHFLLCFDLYLQDLGYRVDSIETLRDQDGNDVEWVRYVSRDQNNRQLLVNYGGMRIPSEKDSPGPWADIRVRDCGICYKPQPKFTNSLADAFNNAVAA